MIDQATLVTYLAILTEIFNPKSALFFLAFLPQFVRPANGSLAGQLLEPGALFVVVGLFSTTLVALGAARVGMFLRRSPAIARWQGKFTGAIYCALGLRLALVER